MNVEKDVVLEEFIGERINCNRGLFNKKEYDIIIDNKELIKKVYILGVNDGKDTYERKF